MAKNKVGVGVLWSAIERFSVQGVQFVIGIIIARLLYPSDYGIIAMLAIFMALSNVFIDGGFMNALIQKKDRSTIDFSTVFYFNLVIATLVYLLLYISAPFIASFYNTPQLCSVARVVGLTLIINSVCIVQHSIIIIDLDFKKLAIISLISVIIGGGIGIYMAYTGYAYWALVAQTVISSIVGAILMWVYTKWKPAFLFSTESFKKMFSFGSKLLVSSVLHTTYTNLYTLIIGKKYAASDVGCYSRAYSLANFPSMNCTSVIERAIYPVFCNIQNDSKELNRLFLSYTRMACFAIFPIMLGICALAKPLIIILLSEKWLEIVPLLQILCIAFMWDPIMRFNHSVINAKGRSDYFLKAEIIKKISGLIILFASLPLGVNIMCWGLVLYSFVDMAIIIYYNTKVTHLGVWAQIKSFYPVFILSSIMGTSVYFILQLISAAGPWLQLFVGCISGLTIYVGGAFLFRFKDIRTILSFIKKD